MRRASGRRGRQKQGPRRAALSDPRGWRGGCCDMRIMPAHLRDVQNIQRASDRLHLRDEITSKHLPPRLTRPLPLCATGRAPPRRPYRARCGVSSTTSSFM